MKSLFPHLFSQTNGNIEFRAISKNTEELIDRLFSKDPHEISTWINRNKDTANLYFGICTRKPGVTKGGKDDCFEIGAYWADLDFKDFTRGETEARSALDNFQIKPSVVVNSGYGLHAYWIFKEIEVLNGNAAEHEARLKGIGRAVRGDNVFDITRVLRIPNTINFPTAKKRAYGHTEAKTCIIEICADLRYNPCDFDDYLDNDLKLEVITQSDTEELLPSHFNDDLSKDQSLRELWEGIRVTRKPQSTEIDRSRQDAQLTHRLVKLGYQDNEIVSILTKYKFGKTHERKDPNSYISGVIADSRKKNGKTEISLPNNQNIRKKLHLTTLQELLAEPEEVMSWVVEDLLPSAGLSIFVAKPKVGKSTLARQLALSVARGDDFIGYKTTKGLVVYLAFEERRLDVKNHFTKMGATEADTGIKIFAGMAPTDAVVAVREMAEQERPTLIVVDTLARLVRIKDLNDYSQTTSGLEPILALAREVGSHVCLLHHAKKGKDKGIDTILGSTGLAGTVDNIIQIDQTEKYRTIATIQRVGVALPETVLDFDVEHGWSSLSGSKEEHDIGQIKNEILTYLFGQTDALEEKYIHEEIEGKRPHKQKALRQLFSEGKVKRLGGGKKNDAYLYHHSGIQVSSLSPIPEYQNPKSDVTTRNLRTDSGIEHSNQISFPVDLPDFGNETIQTESEPHEGYDD